MIKVNASIEYVPLRTPTLGFSSDEPIYNMFASASYTYLQMQTDDHAKRTKTTKQNSIPRSGTFLRKSGEGYQQRFLRPCRILRSSVLRQSSESWDRIGSNNTRSKIEKKQWVSVLVADKCRISLFSHQTFVHTSNEFFMYNCMISVRFSESRMPTFCFFPNAVPPKGEGMSRLLKTRVASTLMVISFLDRTKLSSSISRFSRAKRAYSSLSYKLGSWKKRWLEGMVRGPASEVVVLTQSRLLELTSCGVLIL